MESSLDMAAAIGCVLPSAGDLALEPRHLAGLGLGDLSFSQLEALQELHLLLAKQVRCACACVRACMRTFIDTERKTQRYRI